MRLKTPLISVNLIVKFDGEKVVCIVIWIQMTEKSFPDFPLFISYRIRGITSLKSQGPTPAHLTRASWGRAKAELFSPQHAPD